jgi:L-ascorbate metabolism protein UlaG (beta-lactamase superfamily)
MNKRFLIAILSAVCVVGLLFLVRIPAGAQGNTAPPRAKWARDFNGLWSPIAAQQDITANLLPGEEVSLTPFGAEQYNKIDEADSPAYKCEPYGPTRIMSSALPFVIFQQDNMIGMIFEHIDYRIIYMNGKHPDDILDYPEWEGNSVGHWEGDTLVIDTIGMREESWLDSFGLQHSAKLHVVERYTKTSPDTYIWKVTVDDPVYFTKPFTYAFNVSRTDERIVPDRCDDTPHDDKYSMVHGKAGPGHRIPPTFPTGVARTYIGANEGGRPGRGRGQATQVAKKTKFEEDTIPTSRGDLKITSIAHASVMFTFGGKVIDVDPVGRYADLSQLPKADVILVTHPDPDHLDVAAVKSLSKDKTAVIACPFCSLFLPTGTVMINGETQMVDGLKVEAVAAYNLVGRGGNGKPITEKGSANGYVITFGDKRVYVAGETENVPEVKSLKQIDVAFLPLNPTGANGEGEGVRTMTPKMFADTLQAMQPKVVYPYTYGNNDPKALPDLAKGDKGVEVRVRGLS